MSWGSMFAVGGGAALGAWLRWGLGIALNPIFPTVPLGTVAANLIGGLLMGFAMELMSRHAVWSPERQLVRRSRSSTLQVKPTASEMVPVDQRSFRRRTSGD